ncbi:MBL fold metallo-hydrolase [uncultured Parasphingorhabdus sp.]|uniref:MBL fold metallo-hydrolase n=1 Tax=uncultured Parasphingorhabdus sp. TaxID=2709694 RepID=UPI0030D7C9EC|tara:strand:+ start:18408 stop:19355 length:948 start_codon:yes stop_codon:yes gene_type:complete
MSKPISRTLAVLLLAVSPLALSAYSESNAQEADRFAGVEIKVVPLAEGVAVLFGAGGNIGVSYGPDGTVLIDDQFAPLTPKIQAAIAGLGAEPVTYLINTHWHGDHSGGNENFGKAGALIMAHDHVRERMLGIQKSGRGNDPASAVEALPTVTYHDGLKLHLNGDEVQIKHMKHGHTDGDSIIFWKKANVLHMGDLFFNKMSLPFIDLDSGGNARGILAAADKVLTMVNDDTKIIPGHGPMATKTDLIAYRDMMKTVIGAVVKAQGEGKSLEQVQAMKLAGQWDVNPDAFIKGDAFVAAVYKSVQKPEHVDDHAH